MEIKSLKGVDVGRKVVYSCNLTDKEEGVITSWNERYIFVRYGNDCHSKATNPKHLEFI